LVLSARKVWSAASVIGSVTSSRNGSDALSPAWRRTGLPARRRPCVSEMEWNVVTAGKSFTAWYRFGNTNSSPGEGATSPTQFAGVVQLSSRPPRSQVRMART
jgi:hypothetical protein